MNKPPTMGSKIKRVLQGRFGRTIMFSLVILTAVSWVVVGAVHILLEPTLVQKMAVITVAAVVTEVTFWASAAVLGVSVFQKIKQKFGRKDRV